MSDSLVQGEQPPTSESAEVALIQVAEDVALVFGAQAPAWLDVQPLVGVTAEERRQLVDAAAVSVGLANALAQVGGGVTAAQGLVHLAPETLAALQTLTPMVGTGGNNLGVLVDAAGKIGHVVRWTPAAAPSAATFVASMGTSVALIAIQIQLAQISKKVDANIELTKEVLAELTWQSDAELKALIADVRRAYGEAMAIGAVTEEIYAEVRGKAHLLDKSRRTLLARVTSYSERLGNAGSKDARRKWLIENAEKSLADLQSLVQIQQSAYVVRALRAEFVSGANPTERGQQLVTRIRDEARTEYDGTMEQVTSLADHLQRQLGLMAEDGDRKLGRFKSAREARARAELIRSGIVSNLPALKTEEPTSAVLMGVPEKVRRAVRMLPLITGRREHVQLASTCTTESSSRALLFVLDERIVLTAERDFFNSHVLTHEIDGDSIRYVRTPTGTRLVEMATTEGAFSWEWPTGEMWKIVAWANQLLASRMRLPVAEVPAPPESLGREVERAIQT
ncbi:hypothetical protein FHX74_000521 [Friedmanniella endophytica]|uniref:Uncharacterized protein n=1 Tax=Microlunatus kandeliicorticis TaxID=1759536 RepID=A0A7W3P4K4_9ACTN|nr:hypothetical protein [Microlunatus kandeliicorticis]MBA8792927.1 hypothetical protein [Microlunatus kandeliicorticis]